MNPLFRYIAAITVFVDAAAFGRTFQLHVPLEDGRVSVSELSRRLSEDVHLPATITDRVGCNLSMNVQGVEGWLAVQGINRALGDGFSVSVRPDALVISIDTDLLPKDWSQTAVAIRTFTEVAAPDATARQKQRFGLILPVSVDPAKPLIVVIHGLDGDACSCQDLCHLLREDGKQTAVFAYPAEQPIGNSAALFTDQMKALRETFPTLHVTLITESMGGLVARKYIEGPEFAGNVDRLIMIAPPNQGSNWTPLGPVQKVCTNFTLWRTDKDWSPTWLITEGLNEAAHDLKPGSKFLTKLNAGQRRASVKYTIIAGDQPIHYRIESDLLDHTANLLSGRVGKWWGFRQARAAMESKAKKLLNKTGEADGPVKMDQAKLAGVDDFVVIKADHTALFYATDGRPPAAWDTIRDRLSAPMP